MQIKIAEWNRMGRRWRRLRKECGDRSREHESLHGWPSMVTYSLPRFDRLMPLIRIEGPRDSGVAAYRDLSDSEVLRQHGLFIAEGRLILKRIVDSGRF